MLCCTVSSSICKTLARRSALATYPPSWESCRPRETHRHSVSGMGKIYHGTTGRSPGQTETSHGRTRGTGREIDRVGQGAATAIAGGVNSRYSRVAFAAADWDEAYRDEGRRRSRRRPSAFSKGLSPKALDVRVCDDAHAREQSVRNSSLEEVCCLCDEACPRGADGPFARIPHEFDMAVHIKDIAAARHVIEGNGTAIRDVGIRLVVHDGDF